MEEGKYPGGDGEAAIGALVRLAPQRTYDRRGNALGVKGSGRPAVIWR